MNILRIENLKQVSLMTLLATTCLSRTTMKHTAISKPKMGATDLSTVMLNSYYKKLLGEELSKGNKVNGFIRNKPDSWLNFIDLDKYDTRMTDFNLLPVSDDTVNKVVDRLSTEVTRYQSAIKDNVLSTIKTINDYKDSLKPSTALTDLFSVEVIRVIEALSLLRDKGLLNHNVTSPITDTFNEVRDIVGELSDISTISEDPELAMSLKDELPQNMMDDIVEDIEEILTGDVLKNINNVPLREINVLICLAATASNKLRITTRGSAVYSQLNTLIKHLAGTLDKLEAKYNRLASNKTLLASYKNKKDVTMLYVIGDVFDEYMTMGKGIKPLIGAYLSPLVQNKAIKGVEMFVNISLATILTDTAKLVENADEYGKALILTRQNDDIGKIRSYYVFGIFDNNNDAIFDTESKEAIKKFINKANLAELGDVDNTVLTIFKKYGLRDTNFSIFIDATIEGTSLLGKETSPDMLAGYATLKLVTLYLASQTMLV